jgi:rSAM/selenodomain-associated transferase 2
VSTSLCFVIPVLDEQGCIADLLRYLQARFPESELTVVDGASSDRTVATALPLCTRLLIGVPGRAAQMNLGGAATKAQYLCFLHADCRPTVTARQLQAALARRPLWGFCRVRLDSTHRVFRIIEWFMNRRSALTSVATGDHMLFVQRALFEQSGGFDAIPLMEDVAYSKRLRRLGKPLIVAAPVLASARRWQQRGVLRTVLSMWGLRLAYVAGVPPARLLRHYYSR